MPKLYASLILLSSSLISTLLGWGTARYTPPTLDPPAAPTLNISTFPLNEDQEWFVKPSLLVWRPYQDDIDTGFTLTIPSTDPVVSKDKTQSVDFEWNTGVRLTIGRYLPRHEQWDVTLASTYFYSDTDQTVKGKGSPGAAITALTTIIEGWNPAFLGPALQTKLNWRINYFTWDLAVGRLYNLTRKVIMHPYICLRTMLIYEKYSNKNETIIFNSLIEPVIANTKFKADSSTWGIGPRIGSDFTFNFGHGWSFVGGLSGSIVMGRYNIKESVDGFLTLDTPAPSVPADLRIKDEDTVMRANLEGNIGLGWEKWVRDHSVRIAPSFMFEVTQWYLINNWSATNLPTSVAPGDPDWGMNSTRRMGDLGFLGFTVNLQVDF